MLKLQLERQARGWSIAGLSRRSGLNASTRGMIESYWLRPFLSQLKKVAVVFGLDPEQGASLGEEVAS